MGSNYNHGNRAFLQAIMGRGTLTLSEGKSIVAAILNIQEGTTVTEDHVTQATFDSYIAAAAEAVSCFEYEIRSTQHQITKNKIYAFVNSVSDPFTQQATLRTPDELLYIKRMLDAMFEANNSKRKEVMAITSMQALETQIRKGSSDKGLTQTEAEILLGKLEKENWLERSSKGYYSLAPRALLELRTWLQENYNDSDDPNTHQKIKFCEACKEIVTIGQRCSDLDCNARLHNICEIAYWKSRTSRNCPKCNLEWNGENFVGERAITQGEEELRRKSRGYKRRKSTQQNELNYANSEEQDNLENGSRRRKTLREIPDAND
ncbi:hypothetical protein EPUL_000025, partial [Erysiphe pulchra]